ncbi:FAD-binding oxidoreductase [Sneathiella chinensis]|uniref:D-2-hydroxyacid dehydrogenase n=1 Tax=Sneathiella chinensis TaxID=349750 RepID=A0ABQ5U379_9PROT|nr:FAD-binding oxidoreductase [Sneathiella chinensis]GLQ06532.1 D-2-hydroxyacid dehydrogenase [Sneathiella chinensis]
MSFIEKLAAIVGPKGLITDEKDMGGFLTEWRDKYQGKALAIALPDSTEQVAEIVRLCAETGTPIVPQGGNTGLVGGSIPFDGGDELILSLRRMNKVRDVDAGSGTLTVDAGCILADLQKVAEEHGFMFPLRIGSEGSCQIGGNISTNAGGVQVLHYGNTREQVLGIEAVLPDGQVWDGLTSLRKDNTGYDLKQLFIGAEGTLGIITGAVVKMYPRPRYQQVAMIAIPDPAAAVSFLGLARRLSGDQVTAIELIPRIAIDLVVRHVPDFTDPMPAPYDWQILVELSSSATPDLKGLMESILEEGFEAGVVLDAIIPDSIAQQERLWMLREEISGAQKPEGGSIKHDISVPVSKIPDFIKAADEAVDKVVPGFRPVTFGHIGDGNLHYNPLQPVGMDKQEFLGKWEEVSRTVHDIAASFRGSISAEHGIGRMKKNDLPRYKQAVEIDMMRKIKAALDPQGIMNPGKVLPDETNGSKTGGVA